MKTWKFVLAGLIGLSTFILLAFNTSNNRKPRSVTHRSIPKGCVYRTVMGEEPSDSNFVYKTPETTALAVNRGLSWLAGAQHENGGWGAGSHSRQDVRDPHAVTPDPATTSMVAMALLRSGTTLQRGEYKNELKRALNFLLEAVEKSPVNAASITDVTGTQIQTKLGSNIDVILTSQFLSNMLETVGEDATLKNRIQKALGSCVTKIQRVQDHDGSIAGSGWAGVLQSSFATNALEAAQAQGVQVDELALEKARDFQKNNFDSKTGDVKTDRGAGVVLYSVSGSARSSAKEARRVEEEIQKAKREGKLAPEAAPSPENLQKIGFDKDDALKYSTAYEVYQSAKVQAQREDVMDGFGSNGGEEFLSYLQTGESMIINKDNAWKKWYDNMSGRIIKIQNNDGSWSGHHCITSPVFCTATCLLILSVNNDVDKLIKIGN